MLTEMKSKTVNILGVVAVFGLVISACNSNSRKKELVLKPAAGDAYKVKLKDGNYSVFKVIYIENDTVHVRPNKYLSANLKGLDRLLKMGDTGYMPGVMAVSTTDLKKKWEKEEIIEVVRK